jgi:hypothetical protein
MGQNTGVLVMSLYFRLICGAASLLWTAGFAAAVEPSGTTIAVVPAAAASGTSGRRILEVKGPVFMGDRVQTGASGEAQIEFRDNTRLVVGPNSLMTIDAFVFNENNTAKKISMNAVKGSFRFITGLSRKQAYSIHTPTTTVGVRGTRFDLAVLLNGETSLALYDGQARLCDLAGRCVDVQGSCAVVVAPPGGGVVPVRAGPERAARLRALFPYVASQGRLRPQFRVNTSGCRTRQLPSDPELQPPLIRQALAPLPPAVLPPSERPPPEGPPPEGPEAPTGGNPGNDNPVGNAGEPFGGDGQNGNSGNNGSNQASNNHGGGNGNGNGNRGGGNGNGNGHNR